MPEKPEVITVARQLKTKVLNKRIKSVDVYWNNIIAFPNVEEFKKGLYGKEIKDIKTRGKFLVFDLGEYSLLVHLRMEGKLFFRKIKEEIGKHEHVVFTFEDDEQMRFHDVRKFGKMHLLKSSEIDKVKPLVDLGYEYDDKRLTKEYLYQKIHKKNIPIKTVLLDQSIITGIGNIYDDEILFLSGISPYRESCKVTLKECNYIIDNTKTILDKAISLGGCTIRSFTSSEGVHGLFQNELYIHGKKDEECPKCKTRIEKVKIGGRGTYFCKNCQK